MSVIDTLLEMLGPTRQFYVARPLIAFCGSLETAAVCNSLVWWQAKAPKRAFYKSDYDLCAETCLSRRQLRNSINELVTSGIFTKTIRRANGNPTSHYWLERDNLERLWNEWLTNRNRSPVSGQKIADYLLAKVEFAEPEEAEEEVKEANDANDGLIAPIQTVVSTRSAVCIDAISCLSRADTNMNSDDTSGHHNDDHSVVDASASRPTLTDEDSLRTTTLDSQAEEGSFRKVDSQTGLPIDKEVSSVDKKAPKPTNVLKAKPSLTKPAKKKKVDDKSSTSSHPAVVAVKEVCRYSPNQIQRDEIIARIGNVDAWREVLRAFMLAGKPACKIDWVLKNYSDSGHKPPSSMTHMDANITPTASADDWFRKPVTELAELIDETEQENY